MILLAEYGCLLPWLRPLQSQGARTPANSHVPSGPARIVMLPQLQSALKEGAPRLDFLGKAVALDRNTGIFVTLNPAGKGYGGRSRLPDNLKQLFRRAWQGVTAATLRRAWRPESLYHGLTRRPTLCLPSVDNFWALDCTASFSDWQSLPGAAWLYTCAHMLPNACTNTPPQSRVSPSSETCRPIAMTVPDQELIAEVLLASEGFTAAAALARKLVSLFALARGACSAQQHYDWGLRALKTTVGAAGQLLREVGAGGWHRSTQGGHGKTVPSRPRHGAAPGAVLKRPRARNPPTLQLHKVRDQQVSTADESEVAVRAVCATKLPTLTFEDNSRCVGPKRM
jgi:hypothetical protein